MSETKYNFTSRVFIGGNVTSSPVVVAWFSGDKLSTAQYQQTAVLPAPKSAPACGCGCRK
jgi:hypothetical protein